MTIDRELLTTPKFTVVQRESPSGSTCLVRHPGAVVILPLLENRKICLISNHRPAVGERLVELPAGTLEPGESPLETARRELAEETGYRAAELTPLISYYVSPGILNERMHAFLATGLTSGPVNLMDDEDIESLIVDFDTALAWTRSGRIRDAKSIATLLFYAQFHA